MDDPTGQSSSDAALEEQITELFEESDTDGSGVLDAKEFGTLCHRLSVTLDLGLSATAIREMMSGADEDEDGRISLNEFVPVAARIIRADKKRTAESKQDALDTAKVYMIHGMDRAALEEHFKLIFSRADADGSGVLSRKEFKGLLKESGMGISKAEINYVMKAVDTDNDGFISYKEFVPKAFELLSTLIAERIMAHYHSSTQTKQTLFELLQPFDEENTGVISVEQLKSALEDVGMPDEKLTQVLEEACTKGEKEDTILYRDSMPALADAVIAFFNESQGQSGGYGGRTIKNIVTEGQISQVVGMNRAQVEGHIVAACGDSDPDGTGLLTLDGFRDAINIGLAKSDMKALEASEMDRVMATLGDGPVQYQQVMSKVYDELVECAQARVIGEG